MSAESGLITAGKQIIDGGKSMEKPIVLKQWEVRAIQVGTKTMLRRVIVPQPKNIPIDAYLARMPMSWLSFDLYYLAKLIDGNIVKYWQAKSKYIVGEILFVKESWAKMTCKDCDMPCVGSCSNPGYIHKANGWEFEEGIKWRSPIHMPREAARLFLEVTAVRVERLQDITEENAINEGALTIPNTLEYQRLFDLAVSKREKPPLGESPKQRYLRQWDTDNAKRGYGWDTNPWVEVTEFKVKE